MRGGTDQRHPIVRTLGNPAGESYGPTKVGITGRADYGCEWTSGPCGPAREAVPGSGHAFMADREKRGSMGPPPLTSICTLTRSWPRRRRRHSWLSTMASLEAWNGNWGERTGGNEAINTTATLDNLGPEGTWSCPASAKESRRSEAR